MNSQKACVIEKINSFKEELLTLSHNIHDNPETGFFEHHAVTFITEVLRNHGMETTLGIGGLDTAFIATQKGKGLGPSVVLLAEYDALPNIGHGCGHNVIATCAVGAFLGVCSVLGEYDGSVSIIGTPAEEGAGGKIILLEKGVFDDVDFALMMHPTSGKSLIGRGGRAATTVEITFRGKAAHSSAPGTGINALNAVISTFQHIDMLRATFQLQDNVNGIITKGGEAPNIIPSESECRFSLRARTLTDLKKLVKKVKKAAESAALLTGAVPEIKVNRLYAERYPNKPMCEAFKVNMAELGETMEYPNPNAMCGSSDIGNVSIKVPSIHDYLYIADEEVNSHTAEFAVAAASPRADEVCIKGAQGLALTALDILSDMQFRMKIVEYHEKQIPKEYKK